MAGCGGRRGLVFMVFWLSGCWGMEGVRGMGWWNGVVEWGGRLAPGGGWGGTYVEFIIVTAETVEEKMAVDLR